MLRQLFSIPFAFIVFLSLNVAADSKEPCRLPVLPVSDYSLLRSVEYFDDSSTAKRATIGGNFFLPCEQGAFEVQLGSKIKFNSEAMPKEIHAAESSFVQQGVSASSKIGAEVSISDLGYLLEIEDIEVFSYISGSQQEINLTGALEFYEDGNLSSAEAASSGEILIFGDMFSWEEDDDLYFTPYRTLISKSTLRRLKGDWTLSSSQGNLKLSLDYNSNGEIEIFLLKGDARALHPNIARSAMIQPLTAERFYLSDTDFIGFDLQGAIYKQVGEESVREEFPIPTILTQSKDLMTLNVDGSPLTFERDGLMNVLINRLVAMGQASVALLILILGAFFFFWILREFLRNVANASPDRRHTKKKGGRLKGGGTVGTLIGGGLFALAIPIVAYKFFLDWLQISGPGAYMSFFLF
jgi:hypothetical protein